MSFQRTLFLNAEPDAAWLLDTHLRPFAADLPPFKSFIITGNEDDPSRIDLYRLVMPDYNHQPVVSFVRNAEDGHYERQPESKK